MQKSNETQLKILTYLLFNPKSRFRDLNVDSLSTDTFSYHVKTLVNLGLIKKDGLYYHLTKRGKVTANKLDTSTHKFEKQPKVSVVIVPHRKMGGKKKFVIHQRTKEPYYGYWGFITGKVKWGETLSETAQRELKEESGLTGQYKFCYEIHEMVYDKGSSRQLEDKLFHVIEAYNLKGSLVKKTKDGVNKWVTAKEFLKITPKYHNENDLMNWYLNKDFKFKEEKYYIESF
jgi:ADP-ribose pyrophosphatase YjhB (NUDIX family)